VRAPRPSYQVESLLTEHLPELRPAHRRGLALWVLGTILAGSACQSAVLAALAPLGYARHALRQRLREWTYAGPERAAPCATTLEVRACFAPLLRWILRWWQGQSLALAIDTTTLGERVVVLAVSVLYRGCAIPVAWVVLPGRGQGQWIPALQQLLTTLAPAVPRTLTVLVLTDRGLWSPRLWGAIREHGWHPLMRVRPDATFAPLSHPRRPARTLVPGPGHAWVGAGTAFKHRQVRRQGTLLVVWETEQAEPWLVLSDLAPEGVGVAWYGLRVWVELGFRVLKSLGWHVERTRRREAERVARHWLVLAVATLVDLAYGTRVEDAEAVGVAPPHLRTPPPAPPGPARRSSSVFTRGLAWLRAHLWRGRPLWRRLWLLPHDWPAPAPDLVITYHLAPVPELAA
jgi:Transposase DDE domain